LHLANKSQSFGIFRQPVCCSPEFYRTLTNILKKGFFLLRQQILKCPNMRKVTLAFPDDDSLWSFTSTIKATNISIRPKSNHVSGIFGSEEINRATNELRAVLVQAEGHGDPSFYSPDTEPARRPLGRVRQWFKAIDLRF
jgi:hypothetical protein